MRKALIYMISIIIGVLAISFLLYFILDLLLAFQVVHSDNIILIRNILSDFLWGVQSLIIIALLIIGLVYLIKKSKTKSDN
ncbi:hypothetical protein HDR67_01015 [bacterium]|nr:hypothetical protein [bacterium]